MRVVENVYLEQVYFDDVQQSELVLTTLMNNAWPLCRYRLGDLGRLNFDGEKCFVDILQGRTAQFFTLESDQKFNVIIFSGIARAVCELYGENVIKQFQVIKKNNKNLVILLCLESSEHKEEIKKRYLDELRHIIGSKINIEIVETSFIPPDNITGKSVEFIDSSYSQMR